VGEWSTQGGPLVTPLVDHSRLSHEAGTPSNVYLKAKAIIGPQRCVMCQVLDSGRVQGSGFRVQGAGCRVQGSEFRVEGSGMRVEG